MATPVIAAVMVHVPSPPEGLAWYERAFPGSVRVQIEEHDFTYLQVGACRIEVVCADENDSNGAAGTVVYRSVANFNATLQHLLSLGATLHRGPMHIEQGHSMCQVRDPWGNCIGIRGGSS